MATVPSRPSLVILGAGRPFRGQTPAALSEGAGRVAALQWCLHAFAAQQPEVHFVGGYRFEEIVSRYPDLRYSMNPEWATTGSAGSLLIVPLEPSRTYYVIYGDVMVSATLVEQMMRADAVAVAAVDRQWQRRGSRRKSLELVRLAPSRSGAPPRITAIGTDVAPETADAQYVGLLKLSPEAVAVLLAIPETARQAWRSWNLPKLIATLVERGVPVRGLDSAGEWASFDTPQEVARFILGSKADTLDRLAPIVQRCHVLESVACTVREWRQSSAAMLDRIGSRFAGRQVIVRSSTKREDRWVASQAGRFLSVADVSADDRAQVKAAVGRVIASYGEAEGEDQVLVQPLLQDPMATGVAMTRTIRRGGPYYVLSYEENTSSTNGVTSGRGEHIETIFVHRRVLSDEAGTRSTGDSGIVSRVLPALAELEGLVGHDALDVEFAVDEAGRVVVLQLRPIATDYSAWTASDARVQATLEATATFLEDAATPPPFQVGRTAAWGIMPDWNPAEIIGERPRPLAFSLYRRLVTDDVWAKQRAQSGYRDLRPARLVVSLAGHPYVDVRASFNSFVPAALAEPLAGQLVDAYLTKLRREPELHDKIEFDVALTCLTLDLERRFGALCADGYPAEGLGPLRAALADITRSGMTDSDVYLRSIEILEQRRAAILNRGRRPLHRAAALLDDCARFGTLPFAHLARRAFIATSLLRSAVSEDIIDEQTLSAFMRSLCTVTNRFVRDAGRVSARTLARDDFLADYGHLRPGTYEITAPTYAEMDVTPAGEETLAPGPSDFAWPPGAASRLANSLRALGLDDDVTRFERFCRESIEGRELAKFRFTRNLSLALDALVELGSTAGLSRDDLSYLDWRHFEALLVGNASSTHLHGWVEDGRDWYAVVQAVELPPLIFESRDLWGFRLSRGRPNFVGRSRAIGPLVVLEHVTRPEQALRGAVVMVPQADPGYDWLFTEGIAGLVTVFGGANSHMAVRAAELGLPAAIGIGPVLRDQLQPAKTVLVDSESQRLERLL